MSAISLGPFVFAGDRLAAALGIGAFLLMTALLERRVAPGLGRAAWWALLAGLLGARLGHVAQHWESFSLEPLRMLAFWQGGFSATPGLVLASAAGALAIRSWRSAAALVTAAAVGLLFWAGTRELSRATLGKAAPTAALEQLDGPPLVISELRGRPAVVNLWATWCPPCRREMPLLAGAAAENRAVAFVFVNQAEGPSASAPISPVRVSASAMCCSTRRCRSSAIMAPPAYRSPCSCAPTERWRTSMWERFRPSCCRPALTPPPPADSALHH